MTQREQIRAIGRALAAGDTATAATLAADLAPACDGEGILGQWTPVREILDAIAGRRPSDPPTLNLRTLADGDDSTAALQRIAAQHGIRLGHAHSTGRLAHVMAWWADAPADTGVTGMGATLSRAAADAIRQLMVARYDGGPA